MNPPLLDMPHLIALRWRLRDGLIDHMPGIVEMLESDPCLRQMILAGDPGEETARDMCRAIEARVAAISALDTLSDAP